MTRVWLRLFMRMITMLGSFPSLTGVVMIITGAMVMVIMSGQVWRGWRTETQGKLDPCLTILTLDLKIDLAV